MTKTTYAKFCVAVLIAIPLFLGAETHIVNPAEPLNGVWQFKPVQEWSVEEAGEEIISSVEFINIHRNGTIYFFDYQNHKVVALDLQGKKLFAFGRKGEGPGEIKSAWDMSLVGDQVAVHDAGSYHLFDLKGNYIKTIKYSGESEGLISPAMMLKSEETQDGQSLSIIKFKDKSAVLLKKVASPTKLLAQGGGIRLRVRDANVVTGLKTACRHNTIIFGQSAQYKLYVANPSGKILRSFEVKGRSRPEIPEEYKASRFNRLKLNGSLLGKGMINQLVKCMPDRGPYFTGVLIHETGLVLVMRPEYTNKHGRHFDIFSPAGKYLYSGVMELPDKMEFNMHSFAISGSTLVMFTRGRDDEEMALKKFRINIPPLNQS